MTRLVQPFTDKEHVRPKCRISTQKNFRISALRITAQSVPFKFSHQTVYLIRKNTKDLIFQQKNQYIMIHKISKHLMFQMQIYVFVVLLLSSGAVSGGLEKVLRQAEVIADIYQQFPHSCIFIINDEEQHQSED
jgi:hypothetical protein